MGKSTGFYTFLLYVLFSSHRTSSQADQLFPVRDFTPEAYGVGEVMVRWKQKVDADFWFSQVKGRHLFKTRIFGVIWRISLYILYVFIIDLPTAPACETWIIIHKVSQSISNCECFIPKAAACQLERSWKWSHPHYKQVLTRPGLLMFSAFGRTGMRCDFGKRSFDH